MILKNPRLTLVHVTGFLFDPRLWPRMDARRRVAGTVAGAPREFIGEKELDL